MGPYNTCVKRTSRAQRPLDEGAWLSACDAHNICTVCGKVASDWSLELCVDCDKTSSRLTCRKPDCTFVVCQTRTGPSTRCFEHNACRMCDAMTKTAPRYCSFCLELEE